MTEQHIEQTPTPEEEAEALYVELFGAPLTRLDGAPAAVTPPPSAAEPLTDDDLYRALFGA